MPLPVPRPAARRRLSAGRFSARGFTPGGRRTPRPGARRAETAETSEPRVSRAVRCVVFGLDSRLLRSLLHLHAAAVSVSRRGLLPLGRRKFTYVSCAVREKKIGAENGAEVGSIALEDCVCVLLSMVQEGFSIFSVVYVCTWIVVRRSAVWAVASLDSASGVSLSLASGIRHR